MRRNADADMRRSATCRTNADNKGHASTVRPRTVPRQEQQDLMCCRALGRKMKYDEEDGKEGKEDKEDLPGRARLSPGRDGAEDGRSTKEKAEVTDPCSGPRTVL